MQIRKKSIIQGALILSLASVVTRLLGFAYRIYMTNAIGAEGLGLYQLIMPLYGLAWSISCSGITTSVSKLVAQENAKKEYGNMGRILKQALLITCSIASLLTVLMFAGAQAIAVYFFRDARTIMPMQILSAALPFMAAGSAIRGYFLGLSQSEVPAVSQVLEQCVRMLVIYLIAGTMIPLGLTYACAAAVIGIVAEEFASFLYLMYSYRKFKLKHSLTNRPSLSPRRTLSMILSMALPLTANRVTGSLLSTAENILIPQRLRLYGMTAKESISMFGQVTGMAMPLIAFPSALLTSLSVTLVPAISEASAVNDTNRLTRTISKSLVFTALTGIGACGIFLVLPYELGMVIYNQDIAQILFLFGLMCPFWYIGITISGILNGLGQHTFIFKLSLLSSGVNILFIFFLVPLYGISAFIAGWFTSLLFTVCAGIYKIKKVSKIKLNIASCLIKPALASAASSMSVEYLSKRVLFPVLGGVPGLIVSIGLIACFYVIFLLLLGCISTNDLNLIKLRATKKLADNH